METGVAVPSIPIIFKEIAQLPQLGIPAESIGFTTVTLESDRYVCVRDVTQEEKFCILIDLQNPSKTIRTKLQRAEGTLMHREQNILAIRSQPSPKQEIQIFDLRQKSKLNGTIMSEVVEFWKWINDTTLGIVTAATVYHWNVFDKKETKPKRIFDRLDNLAGTQIINYVADPSEKWFALVGLGKKDDAIIGATQLYSVEKNISQHIEAFAAAFTTWTTGSEKRSLFCFANRVGKTSRLAIIEVGDNPKFGKKFMDIYYPPEALQDFPVAIQASEKHKVLFLITKFGYLHVFHITTGKLIYMNRVSAETIFVTAEYRKEYGMIGVNRVGQILTIAIDPNTVVSYIRNVLNEPQFADLYAKELRG